MIVPKKCRLMNLSHETLERWYGEVEILKRLDHPNILKAQNVLEGLNCSPMSNTLFICMEYRPFHVGVASTLATAIYVAMVTPILYDNSSSLNDSNLNYESYQPYG